MLGLLARSEQFSLLHSTDRHPWLEINLCGTFGMTLLFMWTVLSVFVIQKRTSCNSQRINGSGRRRMVKAIVFRIPRSSHYLGSRRDCYQPEVSDGWFCPQVKDFCIDWSVIPEHPLPLKAHHWDKPLVLICLRPFQTWVRFSFWWSTDIQETRTLHSQSFWVRGT